MLTTRVINRAKKIHSAITIIADVAAWRHSTEQRIDSASQKQIYTEVKNSSTSTLPASSAEGGTPVAKSPTEPAMSPMEKTMRKMIVAPARNFPFITASR